jgi:hypothetical protein
MNSINFKTKELSKAMLLGNKNIARVGDLFSKITMICKEDSVQVVVSDAEVISIKKVETESINIKKPFLVSIAPGELYEWLSTFKGGEIVTMTYDQDDKSQDLKFSTSKTSCKIQGLTRSVVDGKVKDELESAKPFASDINASDLTIMLKSALGHTTRTQLGTQFECVQITVKKDNLRTIGANPVTLSIIDKTIKNGPEIKKYILIHRSNIPHALNAIREYDRVNILQGESRIIFTDKDGNNKCLISKPNATKPIGYEKVIKKTELKYELNIERLLPAVQSANPFSPDEFPVMAIHLMEDKLIIQTQDKGFGKEAVITALEKKMDGGVYVDYVPLVETKNKTVYINGKRFETILKTLTSLGCKTVILQTNPSDREFLQIIGENESYPYIMEMIAPVDPEVAKHEIDSIRTKKEAAKAKKEDSLARASQ